MHEISIAFRHPWLESVFHPDSHHGIFYFCFKSTEMRRLQIRHKLGSAHEKWLRARFEMGGAYSNFKFKIHTFRLI